MSLRFCANLNFLFCENGGTIIEKFRLAKAAGFRGVEIACPDQFSKDEIAAAQKENGLDVALINISLGEAYGEIKFIHCILFDQMKCNRSSYTTLKKVKSSCAIPECISK